LFAFRVRVQKKGGLYFTVEKKAQN